jgi:hypothetical protein
MLVRHLSNAALVSHQAASVVARLRSTNGCTPFTAPLLALELGKLLPRYF